MTTRKITLTETGIQEISDATKLTGDQKITAPEGAIYLTD